MGGEAPRDRPAAGWIDRRCRRGYAGELLGCAQGRFRMLTKKKSYDVWYPNSASNRRERHPTQAPDCNWPMTFLQTKQFTIWPEVVHRCETRPKWLPSMISQEGVSLVVKPTSASYRGRPDREAERSVACALRCSRPKRESQFAGCIRKRHTEASSNLDAGGYVQPKSVINSSRQLRRETRQESTQL